MSRISLHGGACVWGARGRAGCELPITWESCKGSLRDLVTAYPAVVQGRLCREVPDGICRATGWFGIVSTLGNFCKWTSLTDKGKYFIPQIVLSSRAISQQISSAPANCPLKLVGIKQHYPPYIFPYITSPFILIWYALIKIRSLIKVSTLE